MGLLKADGRGNIVRVDEKGRLSRKSGRVETRQGKTISRRDFLRYGIGGIGGFIVAAMGAMLGGYFVSPAFKGKESNWVPIASTKDIKVGVPTLVSYSNREKDGWISTEVRRSAWVVTRDGQNFVVFDPRCTHLGCAYNWIADKEQFLCPCHVGIFDIDGNVISGPPPRPLDRLENRVEGGVLYVGKLFRVEA
jgi:menaquinol-cytochrome c reductase iron-sulfur subunit